MPKKAQVTVLRCQLLMHGDPGRAGGGEEMGGLKWTSLFPPKTAIQGSLDVLTAITKVYT